MENVDDYIFRAATKKELPTVIAMLQNDSLGASRESSGAIENYEKFFDIINADPNNSLMVVDGHSQLLGTFQISFLPNITFGGSWRVQVEGVRVAETARGKGIGKAIVDWVVGRARARDCVMVQLTSNKTRKGALDFYEKLGFVASHEGFKMMLK